MFAICSASETSTQCFLCFVFFAHLNRLKQSGKIKKKGLNSQRILWTFPFFPVQYYHCHRLLLFLRLFSSSSQVKRSFYFHFIFTLIGVCWAYSPKDDDNKIGPFYIRLIRCGLRCTPSFCFAFRLQVNP